MSKIRMVGLVGGMALFVAIFVATIGVYWAKQGGFVGFDRRANTEEWAALPAQFAATSRCQACHSSVYAVWGGSKHKTVNCQNCHGPAADHIQGRGKPLIETSQELCGFCHSKATGRRADFPQVDFTEHGGQLGCITCHRAHAPEAAGLRGGR